MKSLNFKYTKTTFYLLAGLLWCCIACVQSRSSIKQKSEGIYELKYAGLSMEVDASCGGRIISFKLNNKEILSTEAIHSENFGSTLWLSPQVWKWPPSPTLDRGEYLVKLDHNSLRMESSEDSVSGFTFIKTFSVDETDTAIVIQYQIVNNSKEIKTVAPWEVSRVHAGGLSFFPKGEDGGFSKSNIYTEDTGGIIWFQYRPELVNNHQKLFRDGSEGWLAHVNNGLLFIKQFPDIKPELAAPKEAEVEIYANKEKTYIELENQGAYEILEPDEKLSWTVKWYLVEIPSGTSINAGSVQLSNLGRKIVD